VCIVYYSHRARLIAKDGVYLSTVPRLLDEPNLLFAFGSRVDVAVWCPVGTFNMDMALVNDVDQNTMATAGPTVGALIAVRLMHTTDHCPTGYERSKIWSLQTSHYTDDYDR
jgi:hypothetical protein